MTGYIIRQAIVLSGGFAILLGLWAATPGMHP
jgi:hypothetical protein